MNKFIKKMENTSFRRNYVWVGIAVIKVAYASYSAWVDVGKT